MAHVRDQEVAEPGQGGGRYGGVGRGLGEQRGAHAVHLVDESGVDDRDGVFGS